MDELLKQMRRWLWLFVIILFLSGLTAIPAQTELEFLQKFFSRDNAMGNWLNKVLQGIFVTENNFPFLFYGYDWLAFAHFVLAILFAGAIKNPVRNKWVIEFGIICCLLIIPFAMVAGYYRGIPVGWRLIDCCFGIFGLIPLLICYKKIQQIEILNDSQQQI
jgi:hypothetical protein